jgi:hypothetical protein
MKKMTLLFTVVWAFTCMAEDEAALCKALASGDAVARNDARQALLAHGTNASVPTLASMLKEDETFEDARFLLLSYATPEADAALVAALKDAKPERQAALLDALIRRGNASALPVAIASAANPKTASAAWRYIAAFGTAEDVRKNIPVSKESAVELLGAAEHLAANDPGEAVTVYSALYQRPDVPEHLRLGALCGLVANDRGNLRRWMVEGLGNASPVWRGTVARLAARLPEKVLRKEAPGWMKSLPEDSQLTLLRSLVHDKVAAARPLLEASLEDSRSAAVRVAAIEGLGALGDASDVKGLVGILASDKSDPLAAEAARKSLITLADPGTDGKLAGALRSHRNDSAALAKMIQILAIRNHAQAYASKIIPYIENSDAAVRTEVFYAMAGLASQDEVDAVVEAVPKASDAKERKVAGRTLFALARKFPEPTSGAIVKRLPAVSGEARSLFVQALGISGTAAARGAVEGETSSEEADAADEAVRVLAKWQSADAIPALLRCAKDYAKPTLRVLALQGALRLVEKESDVAKRAGALKQAEPLVARPEEKTAWLADWGSVPTAEAVAKVSPFITDAAFGATARVALRKIARTVPVDVPDERAPKATFAPLSFLPHRIAMCRTEACGVADFNGDGKLDICAGPYLYLGPDWKPVRIREVNTDVKADGKGYADDFMNLPIDVNKDGRMDIISGGWFSQSSFWYENRPGEALWPVHLIEKYGNHETGILADVDGDGKAEEFLPDTPNKGAWYEAGKDAEGKPAMIRHDLGGKGSEGVGVGDVSGDGRPDVIFPDRWLEAPADPRKGEWKRHPIALGGPNGSVLHTSDILVYDVNKDGKNDIITSTAHTHGIFWYEQGRDAKGEYTWKQHTIDDTWTQAHYLAFGDIDGDGVPELITGKRFMAHNGGDPDAFGKIGVYYYDFTPGADPVFRKHIISFDEGVSAALNIVVVDIDGDGDLDLVTTGKFGGPVIYENRGVEEVSEEERKAALAPKGVESDPPSDKNLALASKGAKAFSDSELAPGCTARLNDGHPVDLGRMSETRWHSALTPMPHWAEVKLPKPQKVSRVLIRFADPNGYAVSYQVQVKQGDKYVTIKESDNNAVSGVLNLTFDSVETDTVRFVFRKDANPAYPTAAQLGELEVYAE